MNVGIIADTHDNLATLKRAVDCFLDLKIDMLLHAGDYIAPFVFYEIDRLECEFFGVWGNNDGEILGLSKKSANRIQKGPASITVDGKNIVIMHEPTLLDQYVSSKNCDVVIYGHTHETDSRKEDNTLVINPGECCGWLSGKATVGLLDTTTMKAQLVEIN